MGSANRIELGLANQIRILVTLWFVFLNQRSLIRPSRGRLHSNARKSRRHRIAAFTRAAASTRRKRNGHRGRDRQSPRRRGRRSGGRRRKGRSSSRNSLQWHESRIAFREWISRIVTPRNHALHAVRQICYCKRWFARRIKRQSAALGDEHIKLLGDYLWRNGAKINAENLCY
jgi:hypothetical protein